MSTAFGRADILLPKGIDMKKWAVVACDQYTSEIDYWKDVENIVGEAPSTYKITLPEIYLDDEIENRIKKINLTMKEYLDSNLFTEYKDAMIYVERTQSDGKVRCGIVGAIDLEEYDYHVGSNSQVRATEATVVERIPPRVEIRKDAFIELPHIMILIDDDKNTVIEPLKKSKADFEKVYDFELMKNGGKVAGYLLTDAAKTAVDMALNNLADLNNFNLKYKTNEKSTLLYAMGDGNHSLATAKECYEKLKRENPNKDFSNHPARYALVEIVNLHSDALRFEAIHRIITEVDTKKLINKMNEVLKISDSGEGQKFIYVCNGEEKEVYITAKTSKLTVGSLQNFLDEYLKNNAGKIDYIHGIDVLKNLAKERNSIGFILPDMSKSDLFPTVIEDGVLPRKTFSMGHAEDKRFYIEARKIKQD